MINNISKNKLSEKTWLTTFKQTNQSQKTEDKDNRQRQKAKYKNYKNF